jgi:cell division protein FtsI/penicillin-binding protein 2
MRGSEQYSGGTGDIASKTGTAEHGEDSRANYGISGIGYNDW